MKLFSCNNFTGFYPIGCAAIVLAENKEHARILLEDELKKDYLPQKIELDQLIEVNMNKRKAIILDWGNY